MTEVIADQGIDWRHRAACRDEDPELFHPAGPGLPRHQIAEAKAVCVFCLVQGECLEWALAMGECGIWGGTTEDERRAMRRRAASAGSGVGEAVSA